MSITLINKIFGQSLGTKWNPVTESQSQADSIEAAMQAMPTLVTDSADRDSRYGTTPDPGSCCFRLDMGWIEYYYAARPAGGSGDPGRPAGWYPVAGRLPSFEVGSGTVVSIPNNSQTVIGGFANADRSTYGGPAYAGSGFWALNLPGRWLVSLTMQFPAGTSGIRRAAISGSRSGGFAIQNIEVAGAGYTHVTGEYLSSAASDQISMAIVQVSGGTVNWTVTNLTGRYLGPN